MFNKIMAFIILTVFAAGCGLETRTYVMTKDRVGLDQTNGNSGCVVGKCPAAPAPKETTRKVYVLEITKPVPESEVQKIEATAASAIVDSSTTPASNAAPVDNTPPAPQIAVPVVGELPGSVAQATPSAAPNEGNIQAQTYTVQKDDTLQKISKKVFGTYSKWYKIYKANKDKIENPNILKPGTVLTIPVVK